MSTLAARLFRFTASSALACCLTLGIGRAAGAQTASYSVTGWDYEGQMGDYTLGYDFQASTNIVVTALGEWVPFGGTINAPETVGLFDSTGNLLFSVPFTQANATLTGNDLPGGSQFRYVDITSLVPESIRTLQANTKYTVAGTVGLNTYSTNAQGLTADPNITITSPGGLYNDGDTLNGGSPTPPVNYAGYTMYGINFEYGSAAGGPATTTPEPGAFALIGALTVTGTVFLRRRRKQA